MIAYIWETEANGQWCSLDDQLNYRFQELQIELLLRGHINMNRNLLRTLILGALVGTAAMLLPTDAQGQLRYQNRYTKADVSRIISKLENSSDTFRRDFDRAMDNSNLNGTSAEDRYNNNVRDYENSLDRLRREFDRNNSWWETRNDVSNVIREAQTVNNMMNSISFRRNLERQWNNMRNDLNTLADTYDLPGLNGGGWNGGGWGGGNGGWGGGQTSSPPSWARGTFYGNAPNGTQIILTIESNGRANANIGGSMTYGTYYRGTLMMNGNTSRVVQSGNGFRTISNMNGETIYYSRNNSGGGWGGGGSSVPSWAVGRFRGNSPQDGSRIFITIQSNGNVTVNIGGNMNYGNLNGSTLTINGATSTVYRNGSGIRTVSNSDGQTIKYSRY